MKDLQRELTNFKVKRKQKLYTLRGKRFKRANLMSTEKTQNDPKKGHVLETFDIVQNQYKNDSSP